MMTDIAGRGRSGVHPGEAENLLIKPWQTLSKKKADGVPPAPVVCSALQTLDCLRISVSGPPGGSISKEVDRSTRMPVSNGNEAWMPGVFSMRRWSRQ